MERQTAAEKRAEARQPKAGPGTRVPTTAAAAHEVTARDITRGVDLQRIRVVATTMGYYQHKRRREGDVFTLVPLRTVKRATPEDCAKNARLTVGMVLRDPVTKQPIPVIKTAMEQFSDKWMEIADAAVKERITGPNASLKEKHDEIIRDRFDLSGDGDPEEEIQEDGPDGGDPAGAGDGEDDAVIGTGNREVL